MKITSDQIRRIGYILFGMGVALLGEHIINHGGTDWTLNCHGTLGLALIIISFILMRKNDKSVD